MVPAPTAERMLGRFDVIHGTNYVLPPTKRAAVVSVHDANLFLAPHLVSPVARRFAPVLRRAVDRGAWVHTLSHHVAAQLRPVLDTDRIRVVYLAGDRLPPGGALTRSAPFLLAVGTREPRKNYPRLIEAFGLAADDLGETRLVVAGQPGADDPAIDAALDRLDPTVRARVELLGFIDDPTRSGLLAAATVFVFPSIDEGFGLPLLEAMEAGVPIVAARAGAIPEVAGDAALLVDPFDPADMARALVLALEDGALRARLRAAGFTQAAHFTWETTADELLSLYRDAVETY